MASLPGLHSLHTPLSNMYKVSSYTMLRGGLSMPVRKRGLRAAGTRALCLRARKPCQVRENNKDALHRCPPQIKHRRRIRRRQA